MSHYQKTIAEDLAKLGRADVEPKFVEAIMRGEYGTLDHLSRAKFAAEARVGVECWDECDDAMRREIPASYGL